MLLQLDEFFFVVHSHHLDSAVPGVPDVGHLLAWVGEDDALGWVDAHAEDFFDFGLGGSVEGASHLLNDLQEGGVGVSLDCVEGLYSGEVGPPLEHLSDYPGEVDDVERILGICTL